MQFHYNVYGAFRSPREDVALAKRAVDAGFEGIWIGEHFHPWLESRPYAHHAFTWLATVLSEVPDVDVGTSVSCPAYRFEPPVFAQMLATIDQLNPGRMNLGVGVGEAVNEAHFIDGPWPSWGDRAQRLVECLDIVETLWTGPDYVEYDGEFFSYEDVKLFNKPDDGIDLHWAAWGPTSAEYAGRYAGNVITPAGPEHVDEVVRPRFEEGLADGPSDPDSSTITVELKANVGDVDDLVEEVRQRDEYVPAADEIDNPDPRSVRRAGSKVLDDLSNEEVADATNISDDPETFVEQIRGYEAVGVDRVIIGSTCGDPDRTIEVFEDDVLPAFS